VEGLARRGFAEGFRVVDGGLQTIGTGVRLGPRDLLIREFHRFEGVSDPDDMAIVYAVEGPNGIRGTVADAFGAYADPALGEVMSQVPVRPPNAG
jgi:hypothetical protein